MINLKNGTLPKFNMGPKMMVLAIQKESPLAVPFSGSMLNFGRVLYLLSVYMVKIAVKLSTSRALLRVWLG